MKKRMLTVLILFVITISTTFAKNTNRIDRRVLATFKTEFVHATDVSWERQNIYYKASFKLDGRSVMAYFTMEGEVLAVSRNILSQQLPVQLQNELRKGYSNYWISDLFELSTNDGTSYYVTIEDADKKIVMKSTGNNAWGVYNKSRKD